MTTDQIEITFRVSRDEATACRNSCAGMPDPGWTPIRRRRLTRHRRNSAWRWEALWSVNDEREGSS
jgi:hypothetical protein